MVEATLYMVPASFEKLYISLREKEGRVYSDEEVVQLPDIKNDHTHYTEWQTRKESCLRLEKYLAKRNSPMKVLEVGCGNGWLSHRLSSIPLTDVTGIDINRMELQQAKRVFGHIPHLHFLNADLTAPELEEKKFDHIIFAASLQYFAVAAEIIVTALQKLSAGGEIHILDTAFYKPGEVADAKQRTANYFRELSFPEMASFYFHHTMNELDPFNYEIVYQPSFFQRQFNNNKNPFPWISIKP